MEHKDAKPEGALCIFALPSIATKAAADYWEVKDQTLIRHHVCPRTRMFSLANTALPEGVDRKAITSTRFTTVQFLENYGEMKIRDQFTSKLCANRSLKSRWTGSTEFQFVQHFAKATPACDVPAEAIHCSAVLQVKR